MARYTMQWFMYEGDWQLCHMCHLCQPCHHDMEGAGGGIGKCAAARAVTWVSSKGPRRKFLKPGSTVGGIGVS